MSPLNQHDHYQRLIQLSKRLPPLSQLITPSRTEKYHIKGPHLSFSYAHCQVTDPILTHLQGLCHDQHISEKLAALLNNEPVNKSENRAVTHLQSRQAHSTSLDAQQRRRLQRYYDQQQQTPPEHIVHIGTGGSHLGPQLLYDALKVWSTCQGLPYIPVTFISNIDMDYIHSQLQEIPLNKTLFIVQSKSGSTQEVTLILNALRQYANNHDISPAQFKSQCLAVTCQNSPLDNARLFQEIFYMSPEIGGRYSVTSAIGASTLSLAFSPDVFERVLKGARDMDQHAQSHKLLHNMSLLAASIQIWERCILAYNSQAILPYSSSLSRLPHFIQQLECESNGKQCDLNFEALPYPSAPVIIGDTGTNFQHSFGQMLHQGSDITPATFIAFTKTCQNDDPDMQRALIENLSAQSYALAMGQESSNLNTHFHGNRPSRILTATQLSPESLGALISFFENQVMFEGFLLNINSFDQEGVQLGKTLAQNIEEIPHLTHFVNHLIK